MILSGAIANALGVFAGGIIGMFMKKGLPKRFGDSIMYALGLFTLGLGIMFFMESKEIMVLIFSLVLGTLIGELIDIEKRLENLGDSLQSKFKGTGGRFSEGFVTASLLFCVGSMAIMGSLQSGLSGNHEVLYAKTVMDAVSSIICCCHGLWSSFICRTPFDISGRLNFGCLGSGSLSQRCSGQRDDCSRWGSSYWTSPIYFGYQKG